ncbi:hypothetical protein NM208_g1409 [Fusarium decemcellulare]|uniref:Uncharacterized protein n=1 Tax=Fusarium decemcellulare TaxID=57161 RepID=A0ACC1SWF8_9HYPO|nr:hypothetical protein NM208_g1409 [Fusarium decemcellulare]
MMVLKDGDIFREGKWLGAPKPLTCVSSKHSPKKPSDALKTTCMPGWNETSTSARSITTVVMMSKSGHSIDEDLDKSLNRQLDFKHPTIDARTQIRLLRLQDHPTYGVHCTFSVISLEEIPFTRYKALSYTWGKAYSAEDIQEIQVANQPFFVRQNLLRFIQTATRKGEHDLFFIDAICINQLDHLERQFQVREMARVFRNATEVIAWLGTPDASQSDNVRALELVKNKDCAVWTRSQWEGFRYLSYAQYWSRIWVVQEVLLASKLIIWCGDFTFPPALFGRGCSISTDGMTRFAANGRPSTTKSASERAKSPAETILTHRLRYFFRPTKASLTEATFVGTLEEMTSRLTKPAAVLQTYQSKTPDLINQMIRKFGRHECSDPRDKLYGLLGILNETSRGKVKPDYGRSVSYACYQALKVGIEECWSTDYPTNRWIEYTEGTFIDFYCDARDAFGLDDEVSIPILRQVLKELGFRARMQEAIFDAQLQQQFGWCDLQVSHYKKFRYMIMDFEDEEPEIAPGFEWLFRFHTRERRIAENL